MNRKHCIQKNKIGAHERKLEEKLTQTHRARCHWN